MDEDLKLGTEVVNYVEHDLPWKGCRCGHANPTRAFVLERYYVKYKKIWWLVK